MNKETETMEEQLKRVSDRADRFKKFFEMGKNGRHLQMSYYECMKFIDSELLLQRSEIIKQIEGIDRKEHICRFNDGEQKCDCYYEALDAILSLLQPNKTI